MDHNCQNCSTKSCGENNENENKYIVKFRMDVNEIGDYNKKEIEEKLNSTKGITDAVIKGNELIIDYDDILISPEELKKYLS